MWKVAVMYSAIVRPVAGMSWWWIERNRWQRPRDGHLPVEVAAVQCLLETAEPARPEVFGAVAQQPADPVERVVFVAVVAQGLLLDAAADLVDPSRAELDDFEHFTGRTV